MTRAAADTVTFDEAVAIARDAGRVEADRIRANGNPALAREVDAAVGNILQAFYNVRTERRLPPGDDA